MPTTAVSTPDEIWKILKETIRGIDGLRLSQKETDKQLKKTEALFNTQWGTLMESLVEGDLIAILNQQGIPVENTSINVKKRSRDDNYEYDIIAENGQEVVVVEVKTTLRVADVKKFLGNLRKFTTRKPLYQHNTIYGAVAWLKADHESPLGDVISIQGLVLAIVSHVFASTVGFLYHSILSTNY